MKPSLFLAAAALAATPQSALPPTPAAKLDIDDYRPTFVEEFDELSVSAWGDGQSRWIAHTPWSGDFGDAAFTDPRPGFPFTVRDGVLRIEARRDEKGKWRSGLLSALDPKDRGFCQKEGYFEARMKLPAGKGVWPAFWLIGRDTSRGTAEIDVVEYYGHDDDSFEAAWHVWKSKLGKPDLGGKHTVPVAPGLLTSGFHTYGVEIFAGEVTFYLDRQQTWRIPAPETFDNCFYPLVNLALGSGWPIDETPDPSYLWVDYIRVYSRAPRP